MANLLHNNIGARKKVCRVVTAIPSFSLCRVIVFAYVFVRVDRTDDVIGDIIA